MFTEEALKLLTLEQLHQVWNLLTANDHFDLDELDQIEDEMFARGQEIDAVAERLLGDDYDWDAMENDYDSDC